MEGLTPTSALSALAVKATSDEHDFCEIVQQFWAVEEPGTSHVLSTEDRQIESWFQNTTSREVDGRFSVALPLKKIISAYTGNINIQRDIEHRASSFGLGSSRAMALNRLYNLERRLSKDEELYNAYRDFMDEYIALVHMKRAESIGEYFIPHHAVVKRKDNEFKVRVVFDASAPSSSGRSLNDCLVTGPKLQTDIGDILVRSRFYKYIFVADIVKMYRQITVQKEYRVFQHILWRRSPFEEVQEYELCTVTYGLNSAPFLAIRCLLQLEQENGPAFPLARPFIRENTYVDDIIAGANSIEEALEVQRQVIGLLKSGCFELKKWASNCDAILKGVPVQDLASGSCYEPTIGQAVKILGLYWEPYEDKFGYRSTIEEMPLTKRSILSVLARFYDPIGALGPMIFWAKCLMQELWCQGLDWDAIVPENISSKWKAFLSELPSLVQLTLPRQIAIDRAANVQLVGFSDASQKGYAASVFLRVEDDQGFARVYFIACKSKVAPLKAAKTDMSLTIPRLELCAALLLARLLAHEFSVLKELVPIQSVRAFSDSTIVLAWLKAEPKEFKVFVSNRIVKIKELLPQCEWNHVKSAENAADPASRGLLPRELVACGLHLGGPEFLRKSAEQWSNHLTAKIRPDQLPEFKKQGKSILHAHTGNGLEEVLRRFSSLTKMQRTLAYVVRFADSCRRKTVERGPLTRTELNHVMFIATRLTQDCYWSELRRQLSKASSPVTPSSLAQLSPFIDPEGLIRVGGRLRFSLLTEEAKHPILLPKTAYLTRLIITHYHLNLLHAGPKLVMAMVQRKYWIVSGRAVIRQVTHSCVRCVRQRAVNPQPVMADLPQTRVQPHRPFAFVGMDYGGPFSVKESRRRGAKVNKAYLALFICFSVKAVHLEVVSDLSTEAFLAAFDRFTARRGIPEEIRSDCGTTYIGAARHLKTLFNEANIKNTLVNKYSCQWKFNPPAAPHFGGIWEAAIKSVKIHLKRVIGDQVLTMEELTTLIIRIEGILNSRPLTSLSSEPNDLCALTPGHFLIGQPLVAVPEPNLVEIKTNRLNRWQLIRQAQQSFGHRWTREYLHTLQSRQKWSSGNSTLDIGDLVVVNSPSLPLMSWKLGRVTAVHPGPDQIVRVVTVKTADGLLKRPVVKLVKLPVS